MCGIAGYAGFDGLDPKVLKNMVSSLTHRGPDDKGMTSAHTSAIGMRRLAIIDIKNGKQPITSRKGNLSLVFNGEIYNYKDLYSQIRKIGYQFSTNSDTEVILAGYQIWGIDILSKLRGLFSIAILNKENGSIFLARDRIGIKPLYYAKIESKLIFASEIKSILQHPEIIREVNKESISKYLELRYVPGPNTMFNSIYKLPPASFLIWEEGKITIKKYWQIRKQNKFRGTKEEAQEQFENIFNESVHLRMNSERPIGVFLSSGVDSSAVLASIRKNYSKDLNTYSIGFDWKGDEINAAEKFSKKLGCNHKNIFCSADDTKYLPKISWHLDEPVGDGIVLPMYLLSKFAKKDITVIQCGDGADEIFGGYLMHRIIILVSFYKKLVPNFINKKFTIPLTSFIPESFLNQLFDYPADLGKSGKNKLINFLNKIDDLNNESLYNQLISLFEQNDRNKLFDNEYYNEVEKGKLFLEKNSKLIFRDIINFQFEHWLPDNMMFRQDKLSMANSIETRVPFLDHKLIEFANLLPRNYLISIKLNRNKLPIRNYLNSNGYNYLSRQKKVPFYIPIDKYLRSNPLNSMVDELLSKRSIKKRGIFNWREVEELRINNDKKDFLYGKKVFSLTMLELWFRIFVDQEKGWL